MADTTKISWTDHTFNPWIGCQAVSPGCDNCYAETLTKRHGWTQWGPNGERKRTSAGYWRKPLAWDRRAGEARRRELVFCASLADVFDNQAPEGAREDLWQLVRNTPNLDWQLLTKRPQNFDEFLPKDWNGGYPNVWLGVSAENQEEYDRRWPILARTPRHPPVHLLRARVGAAEPERAPGETGLADLGRGVRNSPKIPRPRMDTRDHAGMPPGESGRVWKTVGRIPGQPTGHPAGLHDSKGSGDRPGEQRQGRRPVGRPAVAGVSKRKEET